MSINEATPQDWDRLRKQHPAIDESLMSVYVEMSKEELDAYIFAEEEDVDVVNNPSHYNTGNIECIEAIEESMSSVAFKGYLKGNVQKYMWRYESKAKPAEDLKKARWYLNKLIEVQEAEENS